MLPLFEFATVDTQLDVLLVDGLVCVYALYLVLNGSSDRLNRPYLRMGLAYDLLAHLIVVEPVHAFLLKLVHVHLVTHVGRSTLLQHNYLISLLHALDRVSGSSGSSDASECSTVRIEGVLVVLLATLDSHSNVGHLLIQVAHATFPLMHAAALLVLLRYQLLLTLLIHIRV